MAVNFNLDQLPRRIEQEDPAGGVLLPWVRKLPFRHQGVLLAGIRGCDLAAKEDSSKSLSRLIRRAVMNPAVPDETTYGRGFFGFDPEVATRNLVNFFSSLDQYPLHYVSHLMHASEVIAYKHPEEAYQRSFTSVYFAFCHVLHVRPERPEELDRRLTADRIALGTVEGDYETEVKP